MRRWIGFAVLALVLSLAAAQIGGELAAGTTLWRAGQVAGPALLGLAALLLIRPHHKRLGGWLLAASVLAGLYGLRMEWERLSGGYALPTLLANLDVPLLCVSAFAVMLPFGALLPQVQIWPERWLGGSRAQRSALGGARWMSLAEARRHFRGGQLVIGAAYEAGRTAPAQANRAPLLTYKGDGHLLTVGGSGSGKTRTIVRPNCVTWRGPLVALDPKGNLGRECGPVRQRFGHRVLVLDPHDSQSDAINVLDWLDPSTDKVVLEAETVVGWMLDGQAPGDSNKVFAGQARALIHAVLIDILCDPALAPAERTLLELYRRLRGDRLGETLSAMEIRPDDYGWGVPCEVGTRINQLRNADETWQGVAMYLADSIGFLKAGGAARMLSGVGRETAATSEILSGGLDVFISVPLRTLMTTPAIARLVLGALLNTVYRQIELPREARREVLFLLDEMPRLGAMPLLETARDAGREAGVRLWGIVQDLGQLKKAYGETGLTSWLSSTAVHTFIGINDLDTARYLSDTLGQKTIQLASRSSSRNTGALGLSTTQRGGGWSTSATGVPLIRPEEILQMRVDGDRLPDEHIVIVRQMTPLRCGVVRADKRADLPT